ncbi:hypothetical protein BGZ82_003640 [Podila clonocystis]|nr:hypothetical protein BGZ82_003640 [Podila clonocystis]
MSVPFKIIIVGGGISAIQLEKAGMDYVVLEKARTASPLGSALSLTPSCSYIFDQLGMLDDLKKVSNPCAKIDYIREDLTKIGIMNSGSNKERYGYDAILIAHNLDGAAGSDATAIYKGDILIGADGAYSAIRRGLYDSMIKQGIQLPAEDLEGLRFDSNCVIGTTEVLSEEEYPSLKRKSGDFHVILGKERAIQVYMFTFADNRLGYYFCDQMDRPEQHDEKDFRFSDWKPVAEDELCGQVRNFKCPFGGTVGDLIDKTPKERLSKVMLQDKYFSTWYHQRTILIGDACHKADIIDLKRITHDARVKNQGANQSILDSVHIVNQLYGVPSNSLEDIEKSFRAFYDHRSPNAKEVFQSTSMVASILSKKVCDITI